MKSTTSRLRSWNFTLLISALCTFYLTNEDAFSEVPNSSPEDLFRSATHVLVGELRAIYSYDVNSPDYRKSYYVAEILVQKVEKGDDRLVGELAYARYWHRKWQGEGRPPPGSSGHRGVPAVGSTVKAYLIKGAKLRQRPDKENDQGLDVILPNGLQLSQEQASSEKPN